MYIRAHPKESFYAYTCRSEPPKHRPINLVSGNSVGGFYYMGAKILEVPKVISDECQSFKSKGGSSEPNFGRASDFSHAFGTN